MNRSRRTAPTSAIIDLSRQDRSIALMLAGFLLSCYLLTFTGTIQSSDGLAMFATTESIVRHGGTHSNQLLWMGEQQGTFGRNGDLYSRKGLGLTVLALPLVWLAHQWPALGLVQVALLVNPLITAWTGALLYRTGRRLGWSQRVSLFTALSFGLATLAWPYTQTFFSDPVAGWGLFAAFYGLLGFHQTRRKRYLFAAGAAWGLAYLTRAVNLVTLPLYLAALTVSLAQLRRQAHGLQPFSLHALAASVTALTLPYWRAWTSLALPIVAAGLLSLWWNWLRYADPFESGYLEVEQFSSDWLFGIFGLLVGPARGLIWYSPVLLLAILGVRWFWQRARWVLALILAITVVYVLLYGKWFMWHGGYSWGPRFLVPTLPFLALLTGPAWQRLFRAVGPPWERALIVLLVGSSLAVQFLGLAVPFALVQDWLNATVQPLFAPETFTRIDYSPLVLQWRFLQAQSLSFAWWRPADPTGQPDWLAILLPMVGILVGAALVLRLVQQLQPEEEPTLDGRSAAEVEPLLEREERRRNWLYGVALCLVTVALLVHYQTPLSDGEESAVARQISALEQPEDAVLNLQILAGQRFANTYHGRLPVYGLFPQATLDAPSRVWLDRIHNRHRRLWVIPDYARPEQSGWERALRTNAFLLLDERPAGAQSQRLVLYALDHPQLLSEAGVGTVFGDPDMSGGQTTAQSGWMRLNGYGYTQQVEPGGAILIVLQWQSLRQVERDFHVFVHLLNAAGEKVAQRDGQPVQWLRPTSSWQPGEQIVDRYGLLTATNFPPGLYAIAVGLYDPETGTRLPVSAGPEDDAISLGPIRVGP